MFQLSLTRRCEVKVPRDVRLLTVKLSDVVRDSVEKREGRKLDGALAKISDNVCRPMSQDVSAGVWLSGCFPKDG